MNETIIQKRKLFFSWQDEECETWLSEMSRQGLHLETVRGLGRFRFERGQAKEFAYRMDYSRGKPAQDYQQLIRDAGWEHLGSVNGWEYWRKAIVDGKVPEIFTDNGSKIQKYQRLMAAYVTSAPALFIFGLAMFKRFPGRHPEWLVVLYICLFMAYILYAALNTFMILRRINRLKNN